MPDHWLTIAEAAALSKVHPRTVERRAAAGKVRSRRNDDGQVQVLVDMPDLEPAASDSIPSEAFESVREMADRQIDIAAGSASALVRAAQEQAMRAERQLDLAKQEAGRYRRETKMALVLVAVVLMFVMVAVGYCTSTITAARDESVNAREQARTAEEAGRQAAGERDRVRGEVAAAHAAQANAEGELKAYKTVAEQSRVDPRPKSLFERFTSAIGGN